MTMTNSELPAGIGAPATRALTLAGYTTLDALNGVPARTLSAIAGVGPVTLHLLRKALSSHGMDHA